MRVLLGIVVMLPLWAQEIILLRPDAKVDPGSPAEQVEERGKNGVIDRSITNVSQPSVTVYLPTKETATEWGL